ncbi:hypothetical protein GPECTOR_49g497 [Gonium pectorale]|uniref:Uncharacterized protein n=1 Tax=Gonium pectorale TaxID=33097 RepID=A0A150G805_GONPE|nr:hypothetical protein GPECTOR_49g497 [Gonium pectorale]|eukprot:KXZ45913.1 hypothetical protein GPECTOR_49g497 [Gonium pectorale]
MSLARRSAIAQAMKGKGGSVKSRDRGGSRETSTSDNTSSDKADGSAGGSAGGSGGKGSIWSKPHDKSEVEGGSGPQPYLRDVDLATDSSSQGFGGFGGIMGHAGAGVGGISFGASAPPSLPARVSPQLPPGAETGLGPDMPQLTCSQRAMLPMVNQLLHKHAAAQQQQQQQQPPTAPPQHPAVQQPAWGGYGYGVGAAAGGGASTGGAAGLRWSSVSAPLATGASNSSTGWGSGVGLRTQARPLFSTASVPVLSRVGPGLPGLRDPALELQFQDIVNAVRQEGQGWFNGGDADSCADFGGGSGVYGANWSAGQMGPPEVFTLADAVRRDSSQQAASRRGGAPGTAAAAMMASLAAAPQPSVRYAGANGTAAVAAASVAAAEAAAGAMDLEAMDGLLSALDGFDDCVSLGGVAAGPAGASAPPVDHCRGSSSCSSLLACMQYLDEPEQAEQQRRQHLLPMEPGGGPRCGGVGGFAGAVPGNGNGNGLSYRPGQPDPLVRVAIKLTNRSPDELDPSTVASLRKLLSVYDKLQGMQGYVRPGCTQLLIDAHVAHDHAATAAAAAAAGGGGGSAASSSGGDCSGPPTSSVSVSLEETSSSMSLQPPPFLSPEALGGPLAGADALLNDPRVIGAVGEVARNSGSALTLQLEELAVSVGMDGSIESVSRPVDVPTIVATSCVALAAGCTASPVVVYGTNLDGPSVAFWARLHGVCYELMATPSPDGGLVLRLPPLPGPGLLHLEAELLAGPEGGSSQDQGEAEAGQAQAVEPRPDRQGRGGWGRGRPVAVGPSYPLLVLPTGAAVDELHGVAGLMGPASLRRFVADFGFLLGLPALLSQPLCGVVPVRYGAAATAAAPGEAGAGQAAPSTAWGSTESCAGKETATLSAESGEDGAGAGKAGDTNPGRLLKFTFRELPASGTGAGSAGSPTPGSARTSHDSSVLPAAPASEAWDTPGGDASAGGASSAGAGAAPGAPAKSDGPAMGAVVSAGTVAAAVAGVAAAASAAAAAATAASAAARRRGLSGGAAGPDGLARGACVRASGAGTGTPLSDPASAGSAGGAGAAADPLEGMTNADDEEVVEALMSGPAVRSLLASSTALLRLMLDSRMANCVIAAAAALSELHERCPDRVHAGLAPQQQQQTATRRAAGGEPAAAARGGGGGGMFGLMHAAARAGDLAALAALLPLRAVLGDECNLLARGASGVTPLHLMALLPQAPRLFVGLQRLLPGLEQALVAVRADDGVTPFQLYTLVHMNPGGSPQPPASAGATNGASAGAVAGSSAGSSLGSGSGRSRQSASAGGSSRTRQRVLGEYGQLVQQQLGGASEDASASWGASPSPDAAAAAAGSNSVGSSPSPSMRSVRSALAANIPPEMLLAAAAADADLFSDDWESQRGNSSRGSLNWVDQANLLLRQQLKAVGPEARGSADASGDVAPSAMPTAAATGSGMPPMRKQGSERGLAAGGPAAADGMPDADTTRGVVTCLRSAGGAADDRVLTGTVGAKQQQGQLDARKQQHQHQLREGKDAQTWPPPGGLDGGADTAAFATPLASSSQAASGLLGSPHGERADTEHLPAANFLLSSPPSVANSRGARTSADGAAADGAEGLKAAAVAVSPTAEARGDAAMAPVAVGHESSVAGLAVLGSGPDVAAACAVLAAALVLTPQAARAVAVLPLPAPGGSVLGAASAFALAGACGVLALGGEWSGLRGRSRGGDAGRRILAGLTVMQMVLAAVSFATHGSFLQVASSLLNLAAEAQHVSLLVAAARAAGTGPQAAARGSAALLVALYLLMGPCCQAVAAHWPAWLAPLRHGWLAAR